MAERSAWGIDVGNRALKAIKLVRDGDSLRVDDFEVIEHETVLSNAGDNRESLIQSALAAFAAKHPMKGGAVAVGVSGQASFARFIKLPPVEEKKIPEIVRFEAIQQIPFPLDDVEWSYQLFRSPESPDVEVGIFAMRKELIEQHISYFTDGDMNVQVVQMNPLAVYNAMSYDQRVLETTMLIDLGAENTDLIIADQNTIWLRSIPIGGNNFTEALVKAFKLNFTKAEDLKRNAATSKYARQIFQAMRPVFADLVAEVQRSIGFYASVHRDSRINKMLALGGTFKLPGLQKYLQQNLQVEVERLDNLGTGAPADPKLATGFNDNLLSLVSAYGLAVQAMGEGKITSSLLPQRIRRERLWQEKVKYFAAAAAVFVLASGLGYGRYFTDNMAFEKTEGERSQVKAILDRATELDTKWNAIAGQGAGDRELIKNIRSLENYRELWPSILVDLQKNLPAAPDAAQLKATPRNQRKQIWIDGMFTQYKPDLNPILADADFGKYASDPSQPFATPSGGGGVGIPVYMSGPQDMPQDFAAAAPAPDAVSGEAQRGFLLTISGITPFEPATQLVDQAIITPLHNSSVKVIAGQKYSFAKVILVSATKLRDNQARITALKAAYDAADQAKRGGTVAAGSAGNIFGGATGGGSGYRSGPQDVPTDGAVGFEGGGIAPVLGGPAAVNENAPFLDRTTGEDVRDDWEFKVLVAVVLDPAPKEPPPPPAPAEGTAPPAEGATPPAEGATPPAEGATPPAEGATPPAAPAEGAAPAPATPVPETPAPAPATPPPATPAPPAGAAPVETPPPAGPETSVPATPAPAQAPASATGP